MTQLPVTEPPAADLAAIHLAADHRGSADTVSLVSQNQASAAAMAGQRTTRADAETATAVGVLRSAGWHVISLDASTSLALAWQRLPHAAEMLASLTAATTANSTTLTATANPATTASAVTTAATDQLDSHDGQPA
jgi:hypothetical protein